MLTDNKQVSLSPSQQQHLDMLVAVAESCFLHMVRCWRRWIWVIWGHLQRQHPSPALCGAAVHMLTDMHMHMMQTMMLMTLQRTKVPPTPLLHPSPTDPRCSLPSVLLDTLLSTICASAHPAFYHLCFWAQPYTSRLSRLDHTLETVIVLSCAVSSMCPNMLNGITFDMAVCTITPPVWCRYG